SSTYPLFALANISIVLVPKNPLPDSTVTARVESFDLDIDRNIITWTLGNETITKGVGKNTTRFTMPKIGRTKKLSVYVGDSSSFVLLMGNDIDILYEAETHTPYWYRGLALPTIESRIKTVAIPFLYSNGNKLDSSSLIYEWFLNHKKNISDSGSGKNYAFFKINNYEDNVITVRVSNQEGSVSMEKSIVLSVANTKPKTLFYENDNLLGTLFNKTLQGGVSLFNTISIKAEPFFFSKRGNFDHLTFEWSMNNKEIQTDSGVPNILNLKKDSDASGNVSISLRVQNWKEKLQFAENNLIVNF
ncbi:MAG: hypothetical protein ABII97_02145, partial [Patescibacteria group bacterium]